MHFILNLANSSKVLDGLMVSSHLNTLFEKKVPALACLSAWYFDLTQNRVNLCSFSKATSNFEVYRTTGSMYNQKLILMTLSDSSELARLYSKRVLGLVSSLKAALLILSNSKVFKYERLCIQE